MSEEKKKFIFKVNFSKNRAKPEGDAVPKLITEWNYPRIAAAVVVLLLLLFGVFKLFQDPEQPIELAERANGIETQSVLVEKKAVMPEPVKKVESTINKTIETKPQESPVKMAAKTPEPSPKNISEQSAEMAAASVLPNGVVRSKLATGMWEKEPFGEVQLPIKVNKEMATGIFYFTELEGMSGQTLFHVWKRDGKIIFKQKKPVSSNNHRTYTSKLFTTASVGPWTVELDDANNQPLHIIHFDVVAE